MKQQYLCVFYPSIWPQKTAPGKIGFPKCPEEIQSALISRLQTILKKKNLMDALWKEDENKLLLLEIFRQSVSLHVMFDDTIKRSISVYRYWYLESPNSFITPSELREYRTYFIRDLAAILTSKSSWDSGEAAKKHEALCLEVIQLFKNMFVEISSAIDDATQEVLYFTMLDTAAEVLSPNTSNPHLADSLHGVLLDTILFIWILTRTRNPVHWERLCSTIAGLFHTMETVSQVSGKLIQLTMVIQDKIYFTRAEKKKKTAKRPGMMGGEQSAKHMEPKSPDSVNPPTIPIKDEAISKIDWTVDDILFVWTNMLQIFSTVNSIKSPSIHVASLETLWRIIDLIHWSESKVPYPETLESDRPPFLCVIDIFGHLLFAACELPDAFVEGKAQAYRMLCRMFLRDHIRPLPLYLLSHFYAIIQDGLTSRDSKNLIQDSIIASSSNIFNLALPGANVLIPYYLTEIRRILTSEGRSSDSKERAAIILCSLICFSTHFNGVEVPIGGDKGKAGTSRENSNIHDFLRIAGASSGKPSAPASTPVQVLPLPMSSLLGEVLSIMTDALKGAEGHMDPTIQVRLVWGICVSLFEIVYNQSAANLVISGLVMILLKHITGHPKIVIRAAIHAVTSLAIVADQFRAIDPTIMSMIVESIASNILKEIGEFRANKVGAFDEALLADQIYCLMEWLMVFGDSVCNDTKLIGKVCEALEMALTGSIKSDQSPMTQRTNRGKYKSDRPPGSPNTENPLEEIYSQLVNVSDPSMIALPQVREAAENVILHLLHFLHNVPGKEGIDVLTSFINHTDDFPEGQDPKALHFVHNESVIYTLVEVPKPNTDEKFARIILRDSIGKYTWDTNILFDYAGMDACQPLPFNFIDEEGNRIVGVSPRPTVHSIPPPSRAKDASIAPLYSNVYPEKTDQLDQLLYFLTSSYPDCLPENGAPLFSPAVCMESQKARIDYTEQALVAQIEEDKAAMDRMQSNLPPPKEWQHPYPVIPVPLGPSHHCRMLLSHLGFLSYDNFGVLTILGGETEKVNRSLNQLDLTNGREMIKVGLIYLREGQEEQIEVLRNDASSRSELFSEYVRSIGWPIDVQTHRAYLGGLDPKLTTGVTAPYYATSTYELIFHDLTSMPTTEDPQQIHKKRHVGNDNVHIVWSEHLRDYNPRTIVSEFNDAHIVIYPLPNGLFKIHVYQKENVELFGPLMHGMCVSKILLPALTRATCIMANKYVRYTHEGYVTPFANRKRVLTQIVERHSKSEGSEFRDLIGNIVP